VDQKYTNWEAVVIDDGSTDETSNIISKFIDENRQHKNKIRIIKNEKNFGSPLMSIVTGTQTTNANDLDVIVNLDGDDWLSDIDVLFHLSTVYSNPNILMTYGQYEPSSKKYKDYCRPIPNFNTYRKSKKWVTSHLRTYRKVLFDNIRDEDLRDEDGSYFECAGDLALIFPMIEMAGAERVQFIPKVLYIYNDQNLMNEMKIKKEKQLGIAQKIRNKECYKLLILDEK